MSRTLWDGLIGSGNLCERFLSDDHLKIAFSDLTKSRNLANTPDLTRCSVLLATTGQFETAVALIKLDGIASRIVVCPPDLPSKFIPQVVEMAAVDAVVSDTGVSLNHSGKSSKGGQYNRQETEWILFTSGTTGLPKMVAHSLSSLAGVLSVQNVPPQTGPVWSTFYDIRRYGGLQIFLRATLSGGSLVLSSTAEPTGTFLIRLREHNVTHISGTPSHWRRVLMSPQAPMISPQYLRLSGEIADQAILDNLHLVFPQAKIEHAFASTEAGVCFAVGDGRAGFPISLIDQLASEKVEIKVHDGSLRIRSSRSARGYLGDASPLTDNDGFVDTEDMIERRGDRYYFVGRKSGIINVGGQKVRPEEVEAVINHHPDVQMSLVRAGRSPITGAIVIADVVVKSRADGADANKISELLRRKLLQTCQRALPAYAIPAIFHFVPSLPVTNSGKLERS